MQRYASGLVSIFLLASSAALLAQDPIPSQLVSSRLEALPDEAFTEAHARHLLFRAGFGGSPEEISRMHRLGFDGMVDALLAYEDVPDIVGPLQVEGPQRQEYARLRRLDEDGRRKLRGELRRKDQQEFQKVRAWWAERMLRTRRPLEERMTLFWHGYFTSSYRDVRNAAHMYLQNETLRRHATGSFRELLHAISKDPAMLEYLDNNRNRKARPNENYAREVMELFTLGLGHYSEGDVKEAARTFTGWTFDRFGDEFRFDRRQHDFGEKNLLGTTGSLSGEDTLEILLEHEACATFVARKIWEYFAYEDPDEALVQELGEELRDNEYQLAPLLRALFRSREFYSPRARGAQVKSPIVLAVSTVRMFGMNPPPPQIIVQSASRLGQDLMMPPNVKGWERGLSWITTATLLDRYNVCEVLLKAGQASMRPVARPGAGRENQPAQVQMEMQMEQMARRRRGADGPRGALQRWDPGLSAHSLVQMLEIRDGPTLIDALAERYLLVTLPAARRAALIDFVQGKDGSPPLDFAKIETASSERKLRQLLHLLTSTPEFQVL